MLRTFQDEHKKSQINLIPFYYYFFGQTLGLDISHIINNITDLEKQKKGIDVEIHLENGDIITLDEKIRYKNYGDFLAEIYSNLEYKTPGWTIDDNKVTDYIVYYINENKEIYILDYKKLRNFVTNFKDNLTTQEYTNRTKNSKTKIDDNIYYTTHNIFIKWNELPEDIIFYHSFLTELDT